MCLKNVFGKVRVSEANEHPNVNILFSSSNESCQMLHHHVFKNVFGRVRVSEANEHPNVNIHFSSSKSYRKGKFDMNRAKYYTNMCLD